MSALPIPSSELREAQERLSIARLRLATTQAELGDQFGRAQIQSLGDYATVRQGRLRSGPKPASTSSDYQLDAQTLESLRAHGQRLIRNSPVARSMVRRVVDRVVGSGPIYQSRSTNREFRKKAEKFFARWASQHADARGLCDFGGLTRLVHSGVIVDGDVLAIRVARSRQNGPQDVMAAQLIEAQRLGQPISFGLQTAGGGQPATVNGVEIDRLGRPVRFHVSDWAMGGGSVKLTYTPIVASECCFVVAPGRASQTRGEPRLAALAPLLEQLGDFIYWTVIAAKMGAAQFGVIKRKNPAVATAQLLGEDVERTDQPSGTQSEKQLDWEPGQVPIIGHEDDYQSFDNKQPSTNFESAVRMLLRIAGTDMDLPLELVLMDHSQSTAYAGRAALATVKSSVDTQRAMLQRTWTDPMSLNVVGMGIALGEVPFVEDWDEHRWVWPADPSFEPDKEVRAKKEAIDGNLSTLERELAMMGLDIDEVLEQRAEEMKRMRELGLISTAPAADTAGNGVTAGNTPTTPTTTENGDGKKDDEAADAQEVAGEDGKKEEAGKSAE